MATLEASAMRVRQVLHFQCGGCEKGGKIRIAVMTHSCAKTPVRVILQSLNAAASPLLFPSLGFISRGLHLHFHHRQLRPSVSSLPSQQPPPPPPPFPIAVSLANGLTRPPLSLRPSLPPSPLFLYHFRYALGMCDVFGSKLFNMKRAPRPLAKSGFCF